MAMIATRQRAKMTSIWPSLAAAEASVVMASSFTGSGRGWWTTSELGRNPPRNGVTAENGTLTVTFTKRRPDGQFDDRERSASVTVGARVGDGRARPAEARARASAGCRDVRGLRRGAERADGPVVSHGVDARHAGELAGGLGHAVVGVDAAPEVEDPHQDPQERDQEQRELDEGLAAVAALRGGRRHFTVHLDRAGRVRAGGVGHRRVTKYLPLHDVRVRRRVLRRRGRAVAPVPEPARDRAGRRRRGVDDRHDHGRLAAVRAAVRT